MQVGLYIVKYLRQSNRIVQRFFVALLGVLALSAAFFTNTPSIHASAASACSETYHIVWGDTLGKIAARYGTTWQALATRNNIANPNLIFAGRNLCISGQQAAPAPAQVAPAPVAPAPVAPAPQAAAPAVAQPVAVAAPQSSSIDAMIDQVFGANAGAARNIAMCESGLNPNATNSYSIGGSHAAGLFQILYPSTWYGTSQASNSPYNAWSNIVAAHEIFVRDGYSWREWTCRP